MAHLSCPTCCQGMLVDQWGNPCDPQCTGSNMSLNMPPAPYPMWHPMGTWHGPPPSAMGYPYMMPMGHISRSQSRAPSPTHSVKSRKSTMSKKSRRKYVESEDSEDEKDDRRSVRSERKSVGRFTVRQRPLRDSASVPREVLRRSTLDRAERASVSRSRHSVRVSSSDGEESPESEKESEALLEDEEESVDKKEMDKASKPNVPQSSWECEHCTFLNEAGTRVCSICCKTTMNLKDTQPDLPVVKPPKIRVAEKRQHLQKSRSSDDYSKDYSETESVQNKLMKLKVSSDTYEDPNKISKLDERKKGRTLRKISFWPGTKFTTFQK